MDNKKIPSFINGRELMFSWDERFGQNKNWVDEFFLIECLDNRLLTAYHPGTLEPLNDPASIDCEKYLFGDEYNYSNFPQIEEWLFKTEDVENIGIKQHDDVERKLLSFLIKKGTLEACMIPRGLLDNYSEPDLVKIPKKYHQAYEVACALKENNSNLTMEAARKSDEIKAVNDGESISEGTFKRHMGDIFKDRKGQRGRPSKAK